MGDFADMDPRLCECLLAGIDRETNAFLLKKVIEL